MLENLDRFAQKEYGFFINHIRHIRLTTLNQGVR